MRAISIESLLSHSPMTTDVNMELNKIANEGNNTDISTD